MSLPPDRAHVSTEHRHVRGSLDTLSTDAFLEALLEDQASGIEAVRRVKDAITVFVDQLTGLVQAGGRLCAAQGRGLRPRRPAPYFYRQKI